MQKRRQILDGKMVRHMFTLFKMIQSLIIFGWEGIFTFPYGGCIILPDTDMLVVHHTHSNSSWIFLSLKF